MANVSLGVSVGLRGLDELIKGIKNLSKGVMKDADKMLEEAISVFHKAAKDNLADSVNPEYSTGDLGDSITKSVNKSAMTARTGPNGSAKNKDGETYQDWVEFGHYYKAGDGQRWWNGHHYMGKAWEDHKDKVANNLKASFIVNTDKYLTTVAGQVRHSKTNQLVGKRS